MIRIFIFLLGIIINSPVIFGQSLIGKVTVEKKTDELTISGEGKYIAYTSIKSEKEKFIEVYEVKTGNKVISTKEKGVEDIVVAPDGTIYLLKSSSWSGTHITRTPINGKEKKIIEYGFPGLLHKIFISDDGEFLFVVGYDFVLSKKDISKGDMLITGVALFGLPDGTPIKPEVYSESYILEVLRSVQFSQATAFKLLKTVVQQYKKDAGKDSEYLKLALFFNDAWIQRGMRLFSTIGSDNKMITRDRKYAVIFEEGNFNIYDLSKIREMAFVLEILTNMNVQSQKTIDHFSEYQDQMWFDACENALLKLPFLAINEKIKITTKDDDVFIGVVDGDSDGLNINIETDIGNIAVPKKDVKSIEKEKDKQK